MMDIELTVDEVTVNATRHGRIVVNVSGLDACEVLDEMTISDIVDHVGTEDILCELDIDDITEHVIDRVDPREILNELDEGELLEVLMDLTNKKED